MLSNSKLHSKENNKNKHNNHLNYPLKINKNYPNNYKNKSKMPKPCSKTILINSEIYKKSHSNIPTLLMISFKSNNNLKLNKFNSKNYNNQLKTLNQLKENNKN